MALSIVFLPPEYIVELPIKTLRKQPNQLTSPDIFFIQ